jgi:hypothetical protein
LREDFEEKGMEKAGKSCAKVVRVFGGGVG